MDKENPLSKAVFNFLNECDSYTYQRSSIAGTHSQINEDTKVTDFPPKRKITESYEVPTKERKRSPSPQRMSDWEYIRMREEIASYKLEIAQLENRLRKQAEVRIAAEVSAGKEIKRLESERGRDRAEIKQLRYVVEKLSQNLHEKEAELAECSKVSESERIKLEGKANEAQLECINLKDFLRETEAMKDKLMLQISSLKSDATKVAEELEEEKLKVAKMEHAVRTKAREALYVQKDLEKRAITAERSVQELTHERDFLSESLKEARSNAAWIMKEAELENELKKVKLEAKSLREAVQDKSLLEESHRGLQERINTLESLLKDSAELEAVKNEVLLKLKDWEDLAAAICNAAGVVGEGVKTDETTFTLASTRKALNMLQHKEADLTAELLDTQSRLKMLQASHAQISSGSDTLKIQLNALAKEKADLSSSLNMTRRKLLIVSQERDTYRQLLDSMEQEMTVTGGMFHSSASPQKRILGGAGAKSNSRLEELERLVEKYQKNMELLETELAEERKQRKVLEDAGVGCALGKFSEEDVMNRLNDAVMEERKKLERELEVVWNEKDEIKKECEGLKERIAQLEGEMEHRALKGDFNVCNTKVIHFKMNPTAWAREKYEADLESCQAECGRLRERVKVLEEKYHSLRTQVQNGEACGSSINLKDEDDLLALDTSGEVTKVVEQRMQVHESKEIQKLREELQLCKKLPEKLKEAFRIRVNDFRDACYNLFGYKMKLLGHGRCSISSMYAESPDDHLLFEISPSGVPSLLETPFSATLGDLISVHLMRQHSIPAFVSAVTLELVGRQTVA